MKEAEGAAIVRQPGDRPKRVAALASNGDLKPLRLRMSRDAAVAV